MLYITELAFIHEMLSGMQQAMYECKTSCKCVIVKWDGEDSVESAKSLQDVSYLLLCICDSKHN